MGIYCPILFRDVPYLDCMECDIDCEEEKAKQLEAEKSVRNSLLGIRNVESKEE